MKRISLMLLFCIAINLILANCTEKKTYVTNSTTEIENQVDTVYVKENPIVTRIDTLYIDSTSHYHRCNHRCRFGVDTVLDTTNGFIECDAHNWNGNGYGHDNHEHSPDGMTCLMPGNGNILCLDSL